ncbi:MAG: polysaccharide biosynthesis/export family protein [Planctomyces sp.]|nr:polysaccharide biosynthesis/export family protein [Planctomyces sp.]
MGIAAITILLLTGCTGPNHFMAESLPENLRLASRSNPQEVNLTRLASANGRSDLIGPGDFLEVSIAAGLSEDDQVRIPVRVSEDGTITLPNVGAIDLAGLAPEAAESVIRMHTINKGQYRNPVVTVEVKKARLNRIKVIGAVREPGFVELPPNGSDVVSAIAAAGGLADDAGENVEVKNPIQRNQNRPAVALADGSGIAPVSDTQVSGSESQLNVYTVNLISAETAGEGSYLVEDGGVVHVERRDPAPISVIGLVKSPGPYEFPVGRDLFVLDAIALAGGISNQLADKVYVIRPLANSPDPAVIQVSLRTAKRSGKSNLRLGPGDVVSIEQTPSTVVLEAIQIIRFGVSGSVGTLF